MRRDRVEYSQDSERGVGLLEQPRGRDGSVIEVAVAAGGAACGWRRRPVAAAVVSTASKRSNWALRSWPACTGASPETVRKVRRQQAEQLWDQGFMLGLGGPVTYERASRLRELAATMPLEWLLLETDAPDQPDAGAPG